MSYVNNPAIANFLEYLQIPSVHPEINYDACVQFLKKQAMSLKLPVTVHEIIPKRPIVILSWLGTNPSLPSIMLNSHMDVVPVYEDSWAHPPFSGHIDKDGKIFARGSQDMKCVGIQYLEAVRNLKTAGVQLKRTLHITFVPEEETGSEGGMMDFVRSPEFKALNIGFGLDEGIANPGEEFILFNGERSTWEIHVHCTGNPGHGSLILPDTAGEKLRYIIDKFMDLREQQKHILESDPKLTVGDVTTINLTQIYGGVQSNVVPEKMSVVFDIRVALTVDHIQFENMGSKKSNLDLHNFAVRDLYRSDNNVTTQSTFNAILKKNLAFIDHQIKQWCKEAGEGVYYEFPYNKEKVEPTKLDASNPYWTAIKAAADELKIKLDCRIFPAATDSRFVREIGIPVLGFSPMNFTPILLHDHNEYLKADTFLTGIDIYVKLISAIADV